MIVELCELQLNVNVRVYDSDSTIILWNGSLVTHKQKGENCESLSLTYVLTLIRLSYYYLEYKTHFYKKNISNQLESMYYLLLGYKNEI
jgi:hypothetical protein